MTTEEKSIVKQIKEELVDMRLKTKVMTEQEFKKNMEKVLRLIDKLLI